MERGEITKRFFRLCQRQALAPAYLLTGPDLSAKQKLAQELTLYLNCLQDDKPCLSCLNCKWILASSHPNTPLYLKPQEESKKPVIKIEDCEELQEKLARTDSCYRVVIIEDASSNCFKSDTANKLLKTIEEPPTKTVFLLCAADKELVLATIVSRCQEIYVNPESSPSRELSEKAQELYANYAHRLKSQICKLELIEIASKVAEAERSELIEFFAALEDDIKGTSLEDANYIEAIEQIKTDIQSFVKTDMAIYHALK